MSAIAQISDFTGRFAIPTTIYTSDILQEYIDKYEKKCLIDMLGQKLYKAYIDYLTTEPFVPQERFELFEELEIKQAILGYIYYFYLTEQAQLHFGQAGIAMPKVDAGDVVSVRTAYRLAETIYNSSAYFYRDIQNLIINNLENYPEWDYYVSNGKYINKGISISTLYDSFL